MCSCPMAELVTASDCYIYIVVMLSEGHEFEPHWGSLLSWFFFYYEETVSAFLSYPSIPPLILLNGTRVMATILPTYLVTVSAPSILHAKDSSEIGFTALFTQESFQRQRYFSLCEGVSISFRHRAPGILPL